MHKLQKGIGIESLLMSISDKRAFSPVVASIILVATAVAVSIALAGWFTGFTFQFAQVEDLSAIADDWGI